MKQPSPLNIPPVHTNREFVKKKIQAGLPPPESECSCANCLRPLLLLDAAAS